MRNKKIIPDLSIKPHFIRIEWKYDNLTLKAPITTAADDIHKYFFIVFQRK